MSIARGVGPLELWAMTAVALERSMDGGATWSAYGPPGASFLVNPQVIGAVYVLRDDGQLVTSEGPIVANGPIEALALTTTGLLVDDTLGIERESGTGWTNLDAPSLPAGIFEFAVVDGGLLVRQQGRLSWRTINYGATWTAFDHGGFAVAPTDRHRLRELPQRLVRRCRAQPR